LAPNSADNRYLRCTTFPSRKQALNSPSMSRQDGAQLDITCSTPA
jgi:hypothetical protein